MRRLQFRRRAPGRAWYAILWWDVCERVATFLIQLCFGLRMHGRERIPATGALIYVCNHQSFLDPALNAAVVRDRPFRPFARETLFRGPLGVVIRSLGAIPVTGGAGDKGSMRAALAELEAGRCILIYPEGGRTFDGGLAAFQSGVSILLKRSKATVVPIGMDGAFETWPRTSSRPRLRRPIDTEVGNPIESETLLAGGTSEALRRLEAEIDELRLRCRARLRDRYGAAYPPAGIGDRPFAEREGGTDDR